MDSTRSRPPAAPPAPAEQPPALTPPEAERAVATRAGRVAPLVRRAVRTTRRVAVVSAVAGVVAWWALVRDALATGFMDMPVALLFLAALLAPAALSALGAAVLNDLVAWPEKLRTGAADARDRVRAVAEEGRGGNRLVAVFRAIWAARGLALDAREGGVRVLALARLARLASLPAALAFVGSFALNFVVILFGVIGLVALLV